MARLYKTPQKNCRTELVGALQCAPCPTSLSFLPDASDETKVISNAQNAQGEQTLPNTLELGLLMWAL